MQSPSDSGRILQMSEQPIVSVILYATDLMFRSRINAEARAANRRLTTAATPVQLQEKLEASDITLVLVDMDMPDAAAAIRVGADLGTPVVAYYSHVRGDLREAATAAGATSVMPRSQFVAQLPALLSESVG